MARHVKQRILIRIMLFVSNLHTLASNLQRTLIIILKVEVSTCFIYIFNVETFLSHLWIDCFLKHLF